MVVVVVPQCARRGGKESAEGPASCGDLGLRHAVAAAGPGLAAGPLVPSFSGPCSTSVIGRNAAISAGHINQGMEALGVDL